MKLERICQKLLLAARADQPDDRVPFAFEKRITARLLGQSVPDSWAIWAAALWRGAAACVVAAALFGVTSVYRSHPKPSTATANEEFPLEFQQTMLAAVDQPGEVW